MDDLLTGKYLEDSIYEDGFNKDDLENKIFDEMIKKFEKCDNKILINYKNRVIAHIINSIIKKRGFYSFDEWKLIRKELYVKSKVEELTYETIEKYLEQNEETIFENEENYEKKCLKNNKNYQELIKNRETIKTGIESYSNLSDEVIRFRLLKLMNEKYLEKDEEDYPENLAEYRYEVQNRKYNLEDVVEITDIVEKVYRASLKEEWYSAIKEDAKDNLIKELEPKLKKRFMSFVLNCYYPNFNLNNITEELIIDIYLAVSSTVAWKKMSPGFKEEFNEMLIGNQTISKTPSKK